MWRFPLRYGKAEGVYTSYTPASLPIMFSTSCKAIRGAASWLAQGRGSSAFGVLGFFHCISSSTWYGAKNEWGAPHEAISKGLTPFLPIQPRRCTPSTRTTALHSSSPPATWERCFRFLHTSPFFSSAPSHVAPLRIPYSTMMCSSRFIFSRAYRVSAVITKKKGGNEETEKKAEEAQQQTGNDQTATAKEVPHIQSGTPAIEESLHVEGDNVELLWEWSTRYPRHLVLSLHPPSTETRAGMGKEVPGNVRNDGSDEGGSDLTTRKGASSVASVETAPTNPPSTDATLNSPTAPPAEAEGKNTFLFGRLFLRPYHVAQLLTVLEGWEAAVCIQREHGSVTLTKSTPPSDRINGAEEEQWSLKCCFTAKQLPEPAPCKEEKGVLEPNERRGNTPIGNVVVSFDPRERHPTAVYDVEDRRTVGMPLMQVGDRILLRQHLDNVLREMFQVEYRYHANITAHYLHRQREHLLSSATSSSCFRSSDKRSSHSSSTSAMTPSNSRHKRNIEEHRRHPFSSPGENSFSSPRYRSQMSPRRESKGTTSKRERPDANTRTENPSRPGIMAEEDRSLSPDGTSSFVPTTPDLSVAAYDEEGLLLEDLLREEDTSFIPGEEEAAAMEEEDGDTKVTPVSSAEGVSSPAAEAISEETSNDNVTNTENETEEIELEVNWEEELESMNVLSLDPVAPSTKIETEEEKRRRKKEERAARRQQKKLEKEREEAEKKERQRQARALKRLEKKKRQAEQNTAKIQEHKDPSPSIASSTQPIAKEPLDTSPAPEVTPVDTIHHDTQEQDHAKEKQDTTTLEEANDTSISTADVTSTKEAISSASPSDPDKMETEKPIATTPAMSSSALPSMPNATLKGDEKKEEDKLRLTGTPSPIHTQEKGLAAPSSTWTPATAVFPERREEAPIANAVSSVMGISTITEPQTEASTATTSNAAEPSSSSPLATTIASPSDTVPDHPHVLQANQPHAPPSTADTPLLTISMTSSVFSSTMATCSETPQNAKSSSAPETMEKTREIVEEEKREDASMACESSMKENTKHTNEEETTRASQQESSVPTASTPPLFTKEAEPLETLKEKSTAPLEMSSPSLVTDPRDAFSTLDGAPPSPKEDATGQLMGTEATTSGSEGNNTAEVAATTTIHTTATSSSSSLPELGQFSMPSEIEQPTSTTKLSSIAPDSKDRARKEGTQDEKVNNVIGEEGMETPETVRKSCTAENMTATSSIDEHTRSDTSSTTPGASLEESVKEGTPGRANEKASEKAKEVETNTSCNVVEVQHMPEASTLPAAASEKKKKSNESLARVEPLTSVKEKETTTPQSAKASPHTDANANPSSTTGRPPKRAGRPRKNPSIEEPLRSNKRKEGRKKKGKNEAGERIIL